MINRIMEDSSITRNGLVVLAALVFFCAAIGDLWAYTYTYHNRTDHTIRVIARFYDDADKTAQIEAKKSYVISTPSLLKSWVTEAFLDNNWEQVLNLTCDLLPGNHIFSIYVKEVKNGGGDTGRAWSVILGETAEQTGLPPPS
jgi:hypothetical protein